MTFDFGKVMVTGGSGFLGRNVIRRLVAKGATVHAIARSDKAQKAVEEVGATAFRADLNDIEGMTKAAEGCQYAVHCAANVDTTATLEQMIQSNVEGSKNVYTACRAAGVKKAIHVGTEAGCFNEKGEPLVNLSEETPLPETPFHGVYSTSKNLAEKAAIAESKDGLEVVVVRPRLIWGNDDSVCLPGFIDACRSGILKWFNGGEYKTSTCHVFNVCEGIEKALEKGVAGKSYFLTDGDAVVFKEFISSMLLAAGIDPPTASVPLSVVWMYAILLEKVKTKPEVNRQILVLMGQEGTVSDALARKELGYESETTIAEGIAGLREIYKTKERPVWKEDTEKCSECSAAFSFMKRRHHCRACGGLFCATCTPSLISLKELSYEQKVRVCKPCFESHSKAEN